MLNLHDFSFELQYGKIKQAWSRLNIYQDLNQLNDTDYFLLSLRQLCIFTSIYLGHRDFPLKEQYKVSWERPFDTGEFRSYVSTHRLSLPFLLYDFIYELMQSFYEIYCCIPLNLNVMGEYCFNPLHYAVLRKNVSFVKNLVELDVDLNTEGEFEDIPQYPRFKFTPLNLAILLQSKELVLLLLNQGAEATQNDIHFVMQAQNFDILRVFFDRQIINLGIPIFEKLCIKILEFLYEVNPPSLISKKKWLDSAFNGENLKLIQEVFSFFLISNEELRDYVNLGIQKNALTKLKSLLFNFVDKKSMLIASFKYEYLSILNSILNVLISVYTMSYYSFTKGYQNISSKDLRFFAFGEKQKIENIFDEIENEKKSAVLSA